MPPRVSRAALSMLFVAGVATTQQAITIEVVEGPNGNLQSVPIVPSTQVTITNCLSVGIPSPSPLPIKIPSLAAVEVDYSDANLGVDYRINWTDTAREALLAICGLFPQCPVPIVDFCGPAVVQTTDYGTMRASFSAYSAAAGGGFSGGANYTRIVEGSWTFAETLEITSPVAQVIQLPVHISGDVLAAESFGDPAQTWGKARLEIVGTAFGQVVDRSIVVESQTVLPTTDQIAVTDLVPIAVPAGASLHTVSLTSRSRVEARAQSAGLFGTITGAATAGVNAPNSIRIGRFQAAGGGPIAAGTVIRGTQTGVVYEGIVPVPSPYLLLPGCEPTSSLLYPTAPGAAVPRTLALAVRSVPVSAGVSILFAGVRGTTPLGCGVVTLFGKDVLLDPVAAVIEVASGVITAGVAPFTVPLPANPGLVGFELGLQAIAVGIPVPAIDLSTGLLVVLG